MKNLLQRKGAEKVFENIANMMFGIKKHICSACGALTDERHFEKINALCMGCSNDLMNDRGDDSAKGEIFNKENL